jgi:TolB-like protein/DNA-binding SARP family transcriptional activator
VPTATFQLSLLGRFELSGPDGRPIDLTSKKLAALLAFLACTAPQGHGRDKLMTLLWGSHFDAQARQNLRQALTRLRRILGEGALVTNAETVSLQAGAISSDVAQFEALLADGSRDALQRAVGIYSGRLLADIAIPEEAWTDWIEAQRQRLEGLALGALVKLGEQELEASNHEHALTAANRAIALSNLREDAHRLIMRALAAGGRRADALKHYEELKTLLKRDLAVEPDPNTRSLAAELRKSEGKSAPSLEPSVAPDTGAVLLPLPNRPSIAVLPFANIGGDPEQEYFADGITEDILTALSKWRWFFVLARNSTFGFKGPHVSIRQIGETLGARYVLEGSVRKAGNRLRITAQLIDAKVDHHIWSDSYDRDIGDVFAIQDEITRQVVAAIDPAIRVSELDRIARRHPSSMDAWDHFLRGCHHNSRYRKGDTQVALRHLSRAVEIDPHFAAAHARLALTLVAAASLRYTHDARESLGSALQSANTAVALDEFDASAHTAACYALLYVRQHDASLRSGRRAVALNPNYYLGHLAFALALLFGGAPSEAIIEFEMTIRLTPRDPSMWAILGQMSLAYFADRQYEAANHVADRALIERPDFGGGRVVKAAALSRLGRLDEAAEVFAAIPEVAFQQLSDNCPFRNKADWQHLRGALEQLVRA